MKFKEIPDFEFFESSLSDRNIFHNLQIFGAHEDLRDRLKKTLYYGRLPKSPRTSLPLTEATVELFSKAVPKGKLDILDSDFAASVSRKACISPCSLMLALVYLDRLRHKNPEYLQTVSSCDLFLVSMMVASKYLFDDGEEEEVFNDEWAASANMEAKEVNGLEREFLNAMSWDLFVKPEAFFRMLRNVESKIAGKQGSARGWMTYTELDVLAGKNILSLCWRILMEDVVKVILVSTIAYVSAVATLATAATLSRHCSALINAATTAPPSSSVATFLTINNSLLPLENDANLQEEQPIFALPPMIISDLERVSFNPVTNNGKQEWGWDETREDIWRLEEAQEQRWRLEDAREQRWRPEEAQEGSWRSNEAPEQRWRLEEAREQRWTSEEAGENRWRSDEAQEKRWSFEDAQERILVLEEENRLQKWNANLVKVVPNELLPNDRNSTYLNQQKNENWSLNDLYSCFTFTDDQQQPQDSVSLLSFRYLLGSSLEKMKRVMEGITVTRGHSTNSFWNSLQHLPNYCCGGVNSYFL